MIREHCGQRLTPWRSHDEGYRRGAHRWKCEICGRFFEQRIRRPVPKYLKIAAARAGLTPTELSNRLAQASLKPEALTIFKKCPKRFK